MILFIGDHEPAIIELQNRRTEVVVELVAQPRRHREGPRGVDGLGLDHGDPPRAIHHVERLAPVPGAEPLPCRVRQHPALAAVVALLIEQLPAHPEAMEHGLVAASIGDRERLPLDVERRLRDVLPLGAVVRHRAEHPPQRVQVADGRRAGVRGRQVRRPALGIARRQRLATGARLS
ncbi:hypothetical protein WME85_19370 [Sorangium sp. So ce1153]